METVNENEKETITTGGEAEPETLKTGFQKFLTSFGKFMSMGGFILILAAIIGIAVLISYLTK